MTEVRSTLKPPPKKALDRFHVGQIGDDTVTSFLENSYSLATCCRQCQRLVEWTPPELERRFGDKLDTKIAAIATRLVCAGENGCGSRDIAVFPHHYDTPWTWGGPKAGH